MKAYEILMDIALIIISAKFMGLLARRVKAPMVVGEIIAGVLIGYTDNVLRRTGN